VTAAALAMLLVAALPATASAAVPNPVVTGPIEGGLRGHPWWASLVDLEPYGYVEEEYFIEGVARNFGTAGPALFTLPAGVDAPAPYKTRIDIRRPVDPKRFNGTIVVEWLNVTSSFDIDGSFGYTWPQVIRDGYAWMGVSAQAVGVCCGPGSLKGWDPDRYAPLLHPGDAYSYDIFSQAIQAVRDPLRNATSISHPTAIDPMRGLKVQRVIGTGYSQSASLMTTYINNPAIHKQARVIDAFLIARGGGPYPALDTPLLQWNEEGNFSTLQAESKYFHLWQDAGASHVTTAWTSDWYWPIATRDLFGTWLPDILNIACSMNNAQIQYTARAATDAVNKWMRYGTPPPVAPRLARDAAGTIRRDANGMAIGGLRSPDVQVPVGLNTTDGACPLYGLYVPWSAEKVRSLYPTRQIYVSKVNAWVDRQVQSRFLLAVDAPEIKAKAAAFNAWSGVGSCYDTRNRPADESGAASGAIDGARGDLPLGANPAAHEAGCEVVAPLEP
jgi:hypothetical protein